ncbi:MAG TPA: nuclear transport factor 2 family protein [Kofleriaceae bacterium]
MTNQQAWTIYSHYVAGWRAVSDQERATIIGEVIAPDVHYATPRHETGNRDTVIDDARAFQEKFPGGHFDVGDVSAHHDVALLTWVLMHDDKEVARGHDQIRVNTEGKIVELITFAPSVSKP